MLHQYCVSRGLSITDSPSEVCMSANTSAGLNLACHSHKGDQQLYLSYYHAVAMGNLIEVRIQSLRGNVNFISLKV